jgi:hypothetical protein
LKNKYLLEKHLQVRRVLPNHLNGGKEFFFKKVIIQPSLAGRKYFITQEYNLNMLFFDANESSITSCYGT